MQTRLVLPPYWRQVTDCVFELDRQFRPGMQVPVRLVADVPLFEEWIAEERLKPLIDMASVRGCAAQVVGLPNLKQGEDLPSGTALAMQYPDGFVVPSAIGGDINCGFRLLTSSLNQDELVPRLKALLDELERTVPIGDDRGGPVALSRPELDDLLREGSRYLVREKGIGTEEDLLTVQHEGHFHDAHGDHLSASARSFGLSQLGTLGKGHGHFVELGIVEEIYDQAAASQFGLEKNRVTVLIHASARALGERTHQETVEQCAQTMARRQLTSPRRGYVYAPLDSAEGLSAYHALRAAANYGWANRHVITHQVRAALKQVFSGNGAKLVTVRCDSPSNTVALERIGDQLLCVHRHSATTAYGPGKREQVPRAYRELGEPIVLPGSMGASSYVALSMEGATELSLASASHGAGRLKSRRVARKTFAAHEARQHLEERGVMVRSPTPDLREEIPEAFRDIEKVMSILERAGIVRRVARLRPRGVLKG
jgi:tRNA-splicing ligase RtcB